MIMVITDVRFDNEARRICDLGGVVWEITRDQTVTSDHATEQGISPFLIAATIENNDIVEFEEKIVAEAHRLLTTTHT
jgi:hypothetical protein